MRIISTILFTMAAFISGCAVLVYLYLTSLACGHAPGAASCRGAPWDLNTDDRFWLVVLPAAIVLTLNALAVWARGRSKRIER